MLTKRDFENKPSSRKIQHTSSYARVITIRKNRIIISKLTAQDFKIAYTKSKERYRRIDDLDGAAESAAK